MNNSDKLSLKSFYRDNYILLYLALFSVLIHFLSNAFFNYGYFRDEFYYIACSDHLSLGYVDQPPLSIFILAVNRFLFGDSLFALRMLPAFSAGVTVFLTGLITRKLGGGRFAQAMAAAAVITAPIFMGLNTFYSMNAFDILFWTIGLYLIVRIIDEEGKKYWLWLGVVIGLGMLNKISLLWFIGGFAVGLLLTRHRKKLLSPGPWLAALIAVVLFLPHILWQVANHFPTLEFIRNATMEKMAAVPFLEFFTSQVFIMNPVLFPLWSAGLLYFLFSKKAGPYRLFGFMYLAIFLLLMFSRTSRAGYLASYYPILIAGGAVLFETFTHSVRRWLRPVYLVMVIAAGVIIAPLAMPILPVENYIRYAEFLGQSPSTAEKKELGKLGQFYADMHGWEELARTVSSVYNGLSEEQQRLCVVLTDNYGEAGAIDFFAGRYNLPPAVSGHNNYWHWGSGDSDGEVIIRLGGPSLESLKESYTEVTRVGTFTCDYCMPYENNLPIHLCLGLKESLKEIWPQLKHYD